MGVKKKVELVATNVIDGFDPKNDMCRNFDDFGMDSLDRFGFVADVEDVCGVSVPRRLEGKLKSVSDVVVSVEILKLVKKAKDTWIPCALNKNQQCCYMSDARNDSMWRSSISPNVDFCKAIACDLYCGRQR